MSQITLKMWMMEAGGEGEIAKRERNVAVIPDGHLPGHKLFTVSLEKWRKQRQAPAALGFQLR